MQVNLIHNRVTRKTGNGANTALWHDRCTKNPSSLRKILTFALAAEKNMALQDFLDEQHGCSLIFKRNFKVEEIKNWISLTGTVGVEFAH